MGPTNSTLRRPLAHEPNRTAPPAARRVEEASSPRPRVNDDLRSDPELIRVEALMLQLAAGTHFERLGAIVQEHLLTGGKKLRARLAMESLRALGASDDTHTAWAAACELLHNATLVHDDLQDRDAVRRGKFAVWVRHGQEQAINAGDLLLMLPYRAVDHVPTESCAKWELTQAIARRAEDTVRGQSMEMTLFASERYGWGDYAEAAMGKTSALMALPVEGAALIAGRSKEEAQSLGDCFKLLGLLFQMQDDVLDLYGVKDGRKPGGDIRQGRIAALVVEHLRKHPADIAWLGPILGRPRDETTDDEVEMVSRRFRRGGALRGVLERIRDIEQRIMEAPPLQSEPALRAVALALVERSLKPIRHLFEEELCNA